MNYRKACLHGGEDLSGWAEWSIDKITDPTDKDAWYETNPSLGIFLRERTIVTETKNEKIDFNIQRLGHWLKYTQQSAISKPEWQALEVKKMPKIQPHLFAGVKFGIDNKNVVLAVCAKTADDKRFIEVIDCRPIREGNDWLVKAIMAMNPDTVMIDGQNGKQPLYDALDDARFKTRKIQFPTSSQYADYNYQFEQAIFEQTICHKGQPSLEAVVSNCEHRSIGSSGGFGFRALKEGMEIGLMDACILAYGACADFKEKSKQKVYY